MDRCVVCGAVISEGGHVCPECRRCCATCSYYTASGGPDDYIKGHCHNLSGHVVWDAEGWCNNWRKDNEIHR